MAVTAIGKRYARRLDDESIHLIDVPEKRLKDTLDSYIELFGKPYNKE